MLFVVVLIPSIPPFKLQRFGHAAQASELAKPDSALVGCCLLLPRFRRLHPDSLGLATLHNNTVWLNQILTLSCSPSLQAKAATKNEKSDLDFWKDFDNAPPTSAKPLRKRCRRRELKPAPKLAPEPAAKPAAAVKDWAHGLISSMCTLPQCFQRGDENF